MALRSVCLYPVGSGVALIGTLAVGVIATCWSGAATL